MTGDLPPEVGGVRRRALDMIRALTQVAERVTNENALELQGLLDQADEHVEAAADLVLADAGFAEASSQSNES